MCCTCQRDIPFGAWGGIDEVGGFFPGFVSPEGACYFWCLECPRQNKTDTFQVEAEAGLMLEHSSGNSFPIQFLLLRGHQTWHFGQQMWLRVSGAGNWDIVFEKDAGKCEQLLSWCSEHFTIVQEKNYLENMKILRTA